ncbi:MAG: hypothetical protein KME27_06710 [Lyngbya sp. HA4199-MV5]|jgi:hypothetical protein|nr:hypothetical protein [Lyngbya sp. HA4199-MV5]
MTLDWFNRLSDWNPQVFRELKGRLKQRHAVLAVVGSLAAQLVVLMYFWNVLPVARSTDSNLTYKDYTGYNAYCTGAGSYRSFKCLYDRLGNPQVNWQNWWTDIFQTLSWALPCLLLVAGVYLLIGDLGKEERRGTLNFIRLSPQTSQKILLGKLMGVPAIPYLAAIVAVPFHVLAASSADVSIANLLSVYLLTVAVCAFAYSAALLYALMGGFQGWVGAAAIAMGCMFFYQMLSSSSGWQLQWFHLSINNYFDFGLAFVLLTLGTGSYWLWQAMNRRFRNPGVTLLSKSQSYRMTLCFEVWLLGFVIRDVSEYSRPFEDLIGLGFFNLVWFVVLIAAMTPPRQMLLDWARYRRERVASAKKFWSRSIVKDLLWGEKSPALVAIVVNLLLAYAVVVPWMLTWDGDISPLQGFATIVLGAMFTLICATIAQLLMFMKSQKRAVWAASTIAALIVLPPVLLGFLQFYPADAPLAWLFSIGAFAALQTGVSATMVFTAFLGHLAVLSALSLRLTRQLKRAGESEMKALLAAGRS